MLNDLATKVPEASKRDIAAFLKGKPYMDRELYATAPEGKGGPTIDNLQNGQLIKILKGVFGLADAPREWWKRLSEVLAEQGWHPMAVDLACWVKRVNGKVVGLMVGHVDDLIFTGDESAHRSYQRIAEELGFGKNHL